MTRLDDHKVRRSSGIERDTSTGHLQKIGRDLWVYGVSSAISRAGALLTLPLLTAHLTVEDFGVLEMAAVFTALFSTLLRFGIPPALSRQFVEYERRDQLGTLVSTLLAGNALLGTTLTVAISGLATMLLPLYMTTVVDFEPLAVLVGAIALTQAITTVPEIVLRMERKVWRYNLVNGAAIMIYLAWVIALVVLGSVTVENVLKGQLAGSLVALALGLGFIGRWLSLRWEPRLLGQAVKFGGPLLLGRLAQRIQEPLLRVILLSMTGLHGVALYGVAARVSRLLALPESIFSNAWQPYAMLLLEERDTGVVARVFNLYLGVLCSLAIALSALAVEIVGLLAPTSYADAWVIVPSLSVAIVLFGISSFTRLGLLASKRTAAVVPVYWVSQALLFFLALTLVTLWGPVGAALSAALGAGVSSFALWSLSERHSEMRLDRSGAYLLLGTLGVSVVVILVLEMSLPTPNSLWARLGTAVLAIGLTAGLALRRAATVQGNGPEDPP